MRYVRYVAVRLDGTKTTHASYGALQSAKRRGKGGATIVDSWPESDPPPSKNDARAWDAYRARRGHMGSHH